MLLPVARVACSAKHWQSGQLDESHEDLEQAQVRALPALGQEVNILHLNVGAAMLKAWSVTYSDKPDAPVWAYPNELDLVATTSEEEPARVARGGQVRSGLLLGRSLGP